MEGKRALRKALGSVNHKTFHFSLSITLIIIDSNQPPFERILDRESISEILNDSSKVIQMSSQSALIESSAQKTTKYHRII